MSSADVNCFRLFTFGYAPRTLSPACGFQGQLENAAKIGPCVEPDWISLRRFRKCVRPIRTADIGFGRLFPDLTILELVEPFIGRRHLASAPERPGAINKVRVPGNMALPSQHTGHRTPEPVLRIMKSGQPRV